MNKIYCIYYYVVKNEYEYQEYRVNQVPIEIRFAGQGKISWSNEEVAWRRKFPYDMSCADKQKSGKN